MSGRDEMQKRLEEMLVAIECHSEDAVSLLSKNGVIPKQHGFLCENIFVIDLNSKDDFEKGKNLMFKFQDINDAVITVNTFGKTNRITLHF